MKQYVRTFCFVLSLLLLGVCASLTQAQGALGSGPDPATLRDSLAEREQRHNLDVARQYFSLKKAYVASFDRCEEIAAAYPMFSKIDEVYFVAGMSSFYLASGRGKQRSKKPKDALQRAAREYLSMLVNNYPESQFSAQVVETLQALGGPLPKER